MHPGSPIVGARSAQRDIARFQAVPEGTLLLSLPVLNAPDPRMFAGVASAGVSLTFIK